MIASAFLAVIVCGCAPRVEEPPEIPTTPPPSWAEIEAVHLDRLERLLPFRAGGAVELTWRDERGGRRFETCRGDLMLRTPLESALDLRKVGERFLLVGSDAERQWVFDVRRGEEQAWIRRRGEPWSAEGPPIPAEVDLAELFGMFPLPDAPLVAPRWSSTADVEFMIGSLEMPRRVLLDPTTLLPRRIEVLDAVGEVIVEANFAAYEPVERLGMPPGDRPRFPTQVRLRTTDGLGEIALFLIPPETVPRLPPRLLSLDALLETFRPARIHESETSSDTGPDASLDAGAPRFGS